MEPWQELWNRPGPLAFLSIGSKAHIRIGFDTLSEVVVVLVDFLMAGARPSNVVPLRGQAILWIASLWMGT